MSKVLLMALVIAAVLVTPASADMRDFHRNGTWTVARGTANDGDAMCSIRTQGNGWGFFVKYSTREQMFLHIYKLSWNIPEGTEVAIEVQFDRGTPITGVGVASGNRAIMADLMGGADFMRQFIDAYKLHIRWPGGNERTWTIDLTNTEKAGPVFLNCVEALQRGTTQPHQNAPTQPYRGSGPTQPYQKNRVVPTQRRAPPQDNEL